jgi:hypothetical protein
MRRSACSSSLLLPESDAPARAAGGAAAQERYPYVSQGIDTEQRGNARKIAEGAGGAEQGPGNPEELVYVCRGQPYKILPQLLGYVRPAKIHDSCDQSTATKS